MVNTIVPAVFAAAALVTASWVQALGAVGELEHVVLFAATLATPSETSTMTCTAGAARPCAAISF